MPVIINPQNGRAARRSEWESEIRLPAKEDREVERSEQGTVEIRVTETEHRLLMHLRMLDRGAYQFFVQKDASSMWGLREFRVLERTAE
ncbi:MAG: hypothetical protein JW908_00620 [Anaerolineales bacterium]|nr:hypothetical protein [Anaerolineales bacterium]